MTMVSEANRHKARLLTEQLTLEEKIGMIHGMALFHTQGVPRLGIPPMKFDDGPMGVRAEVNNDWSLVNTSSDFVTYLPSGSAIAATWNPQLAYRAGRVLGQEARGRGKDVILGPSLNIKRSPLCGRNFEYMSEDPFLTATQGVAYINGVQTSDVAACPKHFVANNQETDRLEVNENISMRALREIYFPAFQAAVQQAGALSLMGAYNQVNGVQCCESAWLLDEILRDEWGFEGFVVSDWSAIKSTMASAQVGVDVEMAVTNNFDDYYFAHSLKQAVHSGLANEAWVNSKVEHVLAVMDALHMLDDSVVTRQAGTYATLGHASEALEIAHESIVLLKNDAHVLPLNVSAMRRLLVIGANADHIHSNGGGSAVVKALHEVSPLLGLHGRIGGNVTITYARGYAAQQVVQDEGWQETSLATSEAQKHEQAVITKQLRQEALQLAHEFAASGDPIIMIGGLDHEYDIEGRDRSNFELPYEQRELIEELLKISPDAVIVMVSGSPVAMPWAKNASTIIWNWYAGAESGNALADVLIGAVNPSGHLPETFPATLEDCPAHSIGTFGLTKQVEYSEDIFVGYRYYSAYEVPVQFCFGHGLSYTNFEYRDLQIRPVHDDIHVMFHIENVGTVTGSAVPQLYCGLEGTNEDRPRYELRAFTKIALEAGETQQITLRIPRNELLRYWSVRDDNWALAPACTIFIGESVQDIRLQNSFNN